jgi:hypothetical protein
MKKLLGTFALVGVVGLAACEQREDTVIIEDPVIEQPAPAPVVTEPAPMAPMGTDTMYRDTAAGMMPGTTTAPGVTTTPGTTNP